jgi:hypothetical protein
LLVGSMRVVNHNDRPIGFSRPNSIASIENSNRLVSRRGENSRSSGGTNESVITNQCIQCICDASTGCDRSHRCSGQFCGPFLISWPYWHDAGSLGKNFLACASDMNCAQDSVRSYMRRNVQDCDANERITCDDYAVIHQLGGGSCSAGFEQVRRSLYWSKFRRCIAATSSDLNDRHRSDDAPHSNRISTPLPRHSTSASPPIVLRISSSPPPPSNSFSAEHRPDVDVGNDLSEFRGKPIHACRTRTCERTFV